MNIAELNETHKNKMFISEGESYKEKSVLLNLHFSHMEQTKETDELYTVGGFDINKKNYVIHMLRPIQFENLITRNYIWIGKDHYYFL